MKIKISPLTVVMIAIAIATNQLNLLIVTYAVMTVHELAHLIAAKCIGLKAESITFAPFGVHLTLKNKIVRGFSDEIILYSVGPLVNGIFAIVCLKTGLWDMYRVNIALFIMNMLPVIPLDGGVILRRILSYKMGKGTSEKIMRTASAVLSVSFLTLSIIGACKGYINPSLFIMSVFLAGNLITGHELYNADFINGISDTKKRTNKARLVIVDENNSLAKAAGDISTAYTTIVAITDKRGRIKEFLTDRAIIENIRSEQSSLL